jgi:hypothetical protein
MVGPVERAATPYAVTESQSPQAIARFEAHRDQELGRSGVPGAASPSIANYRIDGSDPMSMLRNFGNRFMATEKEFNQQLDRMTGKAMASGSGTGHHGGNGAGTGSGTGQHGGEVTIDRDGMRQGAAAGSFPEILARAPFDRSARQPMPGSNEVPVDPPMGSDLTTDAVASVMGSANAAMDMAVEGVKLNGTMMTMQKLQAFAQIGTEIGKGAISSLLKAQ